MIFDECEHLVISSTFECKIHIFNFPKIVETFQDNSQLDVHPFLQFQSSLVFLIGLSMIFLVQTVPTANLL